MLDGGAAGQAGQTYFDGAAVGLDVDDVTDRAFLPSHVFVDRGVKLELLCALGCFEGDDDARDDLVARSQVVFFFRFKLSHLPLPHLLRLLDLDANRSAEVFHQHFGLLDL